MSQRVERGNASAHQRRSFGCVERFRHLRQSFHWRDHVFLIAAVVADSANLHVCAVHEISASARKTGAVLPTVPADSNPLACLPFLHAHAQFVDHASYFVSGDARVRNAGEKTFLRHHIAVTDTTGLHLNPHLSPARLRSFALYEFKVRSSLWHLHDFHFCHLSSPLISIQWNRGILSSSERKIATVDRDHRLRTVDVSDDSRVHRWQSRLHS